jgi:predicted RNA-binding protein YlqC (UPF0109 family)
VSGGDVAAAVAEVRRIVDAGVAEDGGADTRYGDDGFGGRGRGRERFDDDNERGNGYDDYGGRGGRGGGRGGRSDGGDGFVRRERGGVRFGDDGGGGGGGGGGVRFGDDGGFDGGRGGRGERGGDTDDYERTWGDQRQRQAPAAGGYGSRRESHNAGGGEGYGGGGYGGGGGGPAAAAVEEETADFASIPCAGQEGRVIGKGGENVRAIQERTGAYVNVRRDIGAVEVSGGDVAAAAAEIRRIVADGQRNDVERGGSRQAGDFARPQNNFDDRQGGDFHRRQGGDYDHRSNFDDDNRGRDDRRPSFDDTRDTRSGGRDYDNRSEGGVESINCAGQEGRIIGKAGAMIRQIQERTGANINISRETGTAEVSGGDVAAAVAEIRRIVDAGVAEDGGADTRYGDDGFGGGAQSRESDYGRSSSSNANYDNYADNRGDRYDSRNDSDRDGDGGLEASRYDYKGDQDEDDDEWILEVGLYKLNPEDPMLESAWFQPLHLQSDILVPSLCFQTQLVPLHRGVGG